MKISDDYSAKISLWIKNKKVYPLPRMEGIPVFKSKKFNSYEEMNQWKKELLEEIARRGGVKWTN
jgi:hypothetical protein